jgi:hypothetical protein
VKKFDLTHVREDLRLFESLVPRKEEKKQRRKERRKERRRGYRIFRIYSI